MCLADEEMGIAQQRQRGWTRDFIAHLGHAPGLIPPVVHGETGNDAEQGHHQGGVKPRPGGGLQNALNIHRGHFRNYLLYTLNPEYQSQVGIRSIRLDSLLVVPGRKVAVALA